MFQYLRCRTAKHGYKAPTNVREYSREVANLHPKINRLPFQGVLITETQVDGKKVLDSDGIMDQSNHLFLMLL